jgi:hypothetical protein
VDPEANIAAHRLKAFHARRPPLLEQASGKEGGAIIPSVGRHPTWQSCDQRCQWAGVLLFSQSKIALDDYADRQRRFGALTVRTG